MQANIFRTKKYYKNMVLVKWSDKSLSDLEKIDFQISKRIVLKVSWLADHFEDIILEPLHNKLKGLYKLRVGDYRVVYEIKDSELSIKFIGHRRDIYTR